MAEEKKVLYCWSHDDETFHGQHETREAAIAEAFEELELGSLVDEDITVSVGEVCEKSAGEYINCHDVEYLLDSMLERSSEDVGEVSEGWLSFPHPAYTMRSGKACLTYGAEKLSEEQREAKQKVWEAHQKALQELEEKIRAVVDGWATDHGHQPNFWGVKNVVRCFRNGNIVARKGG